MNDKNIKDVRKQLRNIAQEILPEVLKYELLRDIEKTITLKVEERLNRIEKHLKKTLQDIEDRQKDTLSYILRLSSVTPPSAPVKKD